MKFKLRKSVEYTVLVMDVVDCSGSERSPYVPAWYIAKNTNLTVPQINRTCLALKNNGILEMRKGAGYARKRPSTLHEVVNIFCRPVRGSNYQTKHLERVYNLIRERFKSIKI
jgi:DNA-binding IscR family transcriptional regulator